MILNHFSIFEMASGGKSSDADNGQKPTIMGSRVKGKAQSAHGENHRLRHYLFTYSLCSMCYAL
jgi:hypothetical protein